jgi:hypothetical protein
MRHSTRIRFAWVVTLLLTACTGLLATCTALMWMYVSALKDSSNVVTANQIEIGRALLVLKEQQIISNSKLDLIREELHALNEKASIAADVKPPADSAPQ